MRKVTFIIDNLLIGGAQVHLLRLTDTLNDEGYRIEIISLGDIDRDIIRNTKSPIQDIKMDCIWKISFWANFLKLISLLRRNKPDIVHTYLNTSNVFGVFAARLAGVPIVISSRRDLGHFRSRRIGVLEKISARLSDKIVCVSQAVRNKTIEEENIVREKTTVIYNGVDTAAFTPGAKTTDNFNIAMVAAMDRKEKGHSYFIEAASLVIKQRKDVKFSLIGDGPLKESLELRAKSLELEKNIIFLGKRDDLHKELKSVDIIVVPSESEGCSNALLEAMAMGIAPIATAVEGNLEIIEDNVSGYLVAPKNPEAIADKILYLIDNPEKIKETSISAHKRMNEKFTLKQMVDSYAALYTGLTNLKIGYVVSLFPCWSETFILNEIIELERKGADISIFSIRKDREDFTQEKTKPYLRKTIYGNLLKCIAYCILSIALKPIIMTTLFWMVIQKKHRNFKEVLKYIWCIFLGTYFSHIALSKKLAHIHAHFATYPAFTAMVISRLTGIPFTFTAHAHDIFLDKPFLKELSAEAKEIVAISNFNKAYIAGYCKNGVASKIQVVHCGINPSDFMPSETNGNYKKNIILSIGRITEMKGFMYLINACGRINPDIPFECRIVGDGPLRNDLTQLVKNLKLEGRIYFDGVIDSKQIKELLKMSDLFVLPSVWSDKDGQEGIPIVLMEAMASGVPVIASKISGIPELIDDKINGILVEPKNETELSEKITSLLTDKPLRERLLANARTKIEQDFDIKKTADKLLEIFTKKQALKALFVIWSLEEGGAERFLTSLAQNFDRTKIEPVICCLNRKGIWAEELEAKGMRVVALEKKMGIDLRAFFTLIKFMKKERFDIVNTQLWESDTMGRVAAILAGIPVIISTAQNVDIWKKWWQRIIDRLLSLRTNKIIAVSEATKEYYYKKVGIPSSKIVVIPNAIDISKFENVGDVTYLYDELGVTKENFILTCIGRLTEQKGHRYLLDSVALLKARHPSIRVLLVGKGEDENSLKKLCRDLNINTMVRFLSFRSDIPQILKLSDALALPSIYEGLPLCVLEAMSAAKPVIVTDAGGNREIVVDKGTGFIVPPRDAVALAEAIKSLLNLSDRGRAMGERGREIIKNNFTIKPIADKTTGLFLSLSNKKQ